MVPGSHRRSLSKGKKALFSAALLCVILVSVAGYQIKHLHTVQQDQGRYNTIAHQFLGLEQKAGMEVSSSSYRLLDKLIDQVTERIADDIGQKALEIDLLGGRIYSEKEGEQILSIIDMVLTDNNFLYRPTGFLTETLTAKKLDNDIKRIIRDKGETITCRTCADNLDISSYVDSREREERVRTFFSDNF